MPGRAPRNGEQRLTGKQSREAGKFLRERWTPETVWSAQEKAELTEAINMLFAGRGEPPVYSTRKLDDWLSNARYRANCKQRAREPESWSLERRAQARQKTRKKNRGAQQKQRRGETAAKLRAVPIATAVPLVGWAAAPRVQVIRQQFEAPTGVPPEVKLPADAGFGWPDAAHRPQERSQQFKAIRDKFERQRIGRTDEWASHRGYSSAPSSQAAQGAQPAGDCAHFFEGDLNGERTAKAPDELVPTFLSVPGLPLPPAVDDDFMQSSPEVEPDVSNTMPAPLLLGADTSQQGLELELDVSLDDLAPGLDLDMDIQSLPVVEGHLHEPMDELSDIQVDDALDDITFDSSGSSGATMKSCVPDYASQCTAPLPETVDDNVDSDRVASETYVSGVGGPRPSVANMSLDTRGRTSHRELTASDTATGTKAVQPILKTAVASTVSAKAVEVDILATPGFLDTDLVMLLPAFDENEVPACLPTTRCCDNYYGHTLQATHENSAQVMQT